MDSEERDNIKFFFDNYEEHQKNLDQTPLSKQSKSLSPESLHSSSKKKQVNFDNTFGRYKEISINNNHGSATET